MIDKNSQFMAILTNVGAAKLANANALGLPWKITALAVGDANGTDPVPSATQTKLVNELRRAPLNQLVPDPKNAAVIVAEQVIPENVGGFWIREIGLYDQDGDLVAVANTAPTFKPLLAQGSGRTQIIRMNLIVSSVANIELKIDPSVVLATREYVDLAIDKALPGDKKAGTYTKVQIDKRGVVIAGENPTTLAGYGIVDAYKKTEVDFLLSSKANNAITLAGYGIGDAYTKTTVDSLLAGKAAKATTLGGYAITDAYTKTEVNNSLAQCITFGKFIPAGSNPSFGSGVAGPMSSITGTIGALQINGEIEGAPAVLALHRPGAFGTYLGLDTDNQLKLGGWSMGAYAHVIYHAGNFTPSSKISGNNCPAAGFASGDKSSPYMSHADGTIVALQVRKPSDTAVLGTTGSSKNADTGEIIQWFELLIGNGWSSPLVKSIVWPSAFPTSFINAKLTFKQSSTAYVASVNANYLNATKNGCDITIGQWQAGQDPTLTLVIEARGK